MTGPEHYAAANALLIAAARVDDFGQPVDVDGRLLPVAQHQALIARAQTHATLALAAATAQQLADRYVGDGPHINAWRATWVDEVVEAVIYCKCGLADEHDGPCKPFCDPTFRTCEYRQGHTGKCDLGEPPW